MQFENILFDKEENVAIIKLNRPRVLNAMNKQLWLDLREALYDARNDAQIKAGARLFSGAVSPPVYPFLPSVTL